jgi:hypothetical protein
MRFGRGPPSGLEFDKALEGRKDNIIGVAVLEEISD